MKSFFSALAFAGMLAGTAHAQAPASAPAASSATADNAAVDACRATGLVALKERSPALKDVVLDMDSLTVAKANTTIEGTPIRTVVMGDAYLDRKGAGKSQRFLCLIGEKGKVLLTFFTAQ